MITLFLLLAATAPSGASGSSQAAEPPAKVSITVAPTPASPGGDAAVTVLLQPAPGIKINKYPKIRLQVSASPGVVAAADGAIGASGPPPSDQLESNYYKGGVDPLVVPLAVDPSATPGSHDVRGRLNYFYCVSASGYCAPAKVEVSIPLTVR